MECRIPKKGEIYRHFKGNLYEIVLIARDSETLEEKVVYKEVDGESAYVRALPMFVSEVDKEKYPDVVQEYRFELVEKLEEVIKSQDDVQGCSKEQEMIMEYLNLDATNDKIEYLLRAKEQLTERFVETVAQSLEFVENDGDLHQRCDAIINYLRTVARFETGRLR